jgi:very-long-chain (3R)-3-hydroxyacyl-CoA dehydratase
VMAANGEQFYVCDAIVTDQGPNYILAKRLQHWRAMVVRANAAARSTTGLQAVVSSNVAPSTATLSVVSNKSFALAYQGMHHFRPVEVFQQETSSAVMALLLIHDVCNDHSAANPATPLRHPLTLFTATSFHGGAWRCAYKFGSIGAGSVLAAIATNYVTKGYLALYNGLQAVGWGAVLGQVALHALSRSAAPLWGPTLGRTVATFQWLAVLEVLHAAVGAVRSPVGTTFVQVLSRVLLVSAVQYDPVLQSRDNPFLWLMLVAWSVTEIVRYGYYAAGQWRPPPRLLTWLRYTLFLVLYPAGVAGEMGCLHRAIPGLERTPGPDAPFLVRHALHPILRWPLGYYAVVVPVYIVGLKTLYSYMLAQRRRILGDTAPKGKVKAE